MEVSILSRGNRDTFERHADAQSSSFRSAINSETFFSDASPPVRASFIAAAVATLRTFRSNGYAFCAATRVSKTFTASEIDSPMAESAFPACAFTRLAMRM
jgi:hypothetical protein